MQHPSDPKALNDTETSECERQSSSMASGELGRTSSDRILAVLMEHTPMPAACMDPDFNFMWVNRAYARANRQEPAFFRDKNHFDLYPDAENQSIFKRARDTGEPFHAKAKPITYPATPQCAATWWDWSLIPVKGEAGQVSELVLVLTDVTEQVDTRETLRQSEANLWTMIDASPESAFLTDAEGMVITGNRIGAERLGKRREEIVGRSIFDFIPPDLAETRRSHFARVLQSGQAIEFEDRREGRVFHHYLRPLLDEDGNPKRVAGFSHDITAHRELGKRLNAQNELLAAIGEAMAFFISGASHTEIYERVLKILVRATDSQYGFLDEVVRNPEGKFYRRSLALSDLFSNEDFQRIYEELRPERFQLYNPKDLNGPSALKGRTIITDDDYSDSPTQPRPPIQPKAVHYMGIPMYFRDGLIGIIGVANHQQEYSEETTAFIRPLLQACTAMIQAGRLERSETETLEKQKILKTRISQAIDIARLAYWEYDVARDLFWFDDAFYKIFGTTVDQVGGYSMSPREYAERFLYPEDRPLVEAETRKAMETDDPSFNRRLEHRILYADGTVGWISVQYFIVKDENGRTIKTYGVNQDITDRKLAEQALFDSERKWRNILVNVPQIGISLDPRARVVFANDYFLRLTGWTEQEVIGQEWLEMFIPEAGRNEIKQIHLQVVQKKDITGFSSYENEILTRAGDVRNIAWSNVLTKDAQGEVIDVTCLGVDLTERKRAEEALRESEEKYRLLSEKIPDIVWMANLDLKTVFVSPSIEKLLGFTPEERLQQTLPQQLTPDSVAYAMDRFARELMLEKKRLGEPERTVGFELEYYHKDGSTRWMDTIASAVRDECGELIGIHGVSRDITERKRAEAEYEKLQAQLLQAHKMESVGRLAGGVAHDFNNMLGVILGYAELALEQTGEGHPLHDSLKEIHEAARRSARLTRQLLAFARKQIVNPKVMDLNDKVEGMLKMLRRLIGEDVDLRWLPCAKLWPVKIDPSQVDQILANLCVNARDAISGTGQVTIRTGTRIFNATECAAIPESSPGEFVMLEVIDDGCGMDAETREHLFEPFFTTKKMGEGTGLGLPMVYGIVKQNEGFVYVDSQPGRGATVKIYLPRYKAEPTEGQTGQYPPETVAGGSETLLLVEDEPSILKVGKTMLERLGYHVLAASNPGDALRLARTRKDRIDLLITDVIMPEMNGRELAEKMLVLFPGLKVLFMSGYTADVIARRGILEEGVHFIQKPFSYREVAKKVRGAMDD